MNRRASLPGADELFRSTGDRVRPLRDDTRERPDAPGRDDPGEQTPSVEASGRTSHDAKITVYLTQQELLDLEQARLTLQADYDVKVDRGRIVREAIADLLLDLHTAGPEARIVRKLT